MKFSFDLRSPLLYDQKYQPISHEEREEEEDNGRREKVKNTING